MPHHPDRRARRNALATFTEQQHLPCFVVYWGGGCQVPIYAEDDDTALELARTVYGIEPDRAELAEGDR